MIGATNWSFVRDVTESLYHCLTLLWKPIHRASDIQLNIEVQKTHVNTKYSQLALRRVPSATSSLKRGSSYSTAAANVILCLINCEKKHICINTSHYCIYMPLPDCLYARKTFAGWGSGEILDSMEAYMYEPTIPPGLCFISDKITVVSVISNSVSWS